MYLSASFLVKIKKMLLSIFIVIFALVSVCLVFVLSLMALVYLNAYCHVEFVKPDYPVSLEKILPLNEIDIIDSRYNGYFTSTDHEKYFIIKFKNENGFDDFIKKTVLLDADFNNKSTALAYTYEGVFESRDVINKFPQYFDFKSIIYSRFMIPAEYLKSKYYARMIISSDKKYLYIQMETRN